MSHRNVPSNPFAWIEEGLYEIDRQHLRRRLRQRGSEQAAELVIDGQRLVNFGSNDYLGLARDQRLIHAAMAAAEAFGWGSGASPLITGHSTLHAQLESEIAKFEQSEAAVLFPTGYAANVGAITSLADNQSVIFSDSKNHASIIDGCRLSGAKVEIYHHSECDHLADLLDANSRLSEGECRKLIVTDGLFSMDGDLAPIPELVELSKSHNAMLLVDEAHATGVLGSRGGGTCEHFGFGHDNSECRSLITVGTMSKALGSLGGFVAGPQRVIDWMINRCRTFVFSTATPDAVCAASLAALDIVRNEPERRMRLVELSKGLRDRLLASGFRVGNSETQIVPVILEDPERTMRVSGELREKGLLVPGIRPPSVPQGESLLRISLSYDHTEEMVENLVDALILASR